MESPNIVKTEGEEPVEEEELSIIWVNTKGSCFLCLRTSKEFKVISLRSLLRHLQINKQEVYTDNDGNALSARNGEWDDIEVDLCKSCSATYIRLRSLLVQLEKIQMEVNGLLEETKKNIFESGRNPKLGERLFAKLSSNPRTPFNFDFVDNLRKRIAEKCKIMQSGRQLESTLESGIPEAVCDNGTRSSEDADSSSHRIQMLNRTAIAAAEGEPSAHPSLHSAVSSEPRRSLRRSKQEALLEKENPFAMSTGQMSKDADASTSKCQETQTYAGNSLKSSSTRESKYLKKNGLTGLYQCRKCDKQSTCQATIYRHYESFHLKIRHQCDICDMTLSARRDRLASHRLKCQQKLEERLAREKDPKFGFVCEICGKRFESQTKVGKHLRQVHKNVDRYPCDLCDKKFKSSHHLKEHKDRVHFGKKISCRFCKKLYGSGSRSNLKKHENSCMVKNDKGLAKHV